MCLFSAELFYWSIGWWLTFWWAAGHPLRSLPYRVQLHIQILINKTVRLWFCSQTLSGLPFAMCYLRVICIILDIIIAGIIRCNIVTESSWISWSELLRYREGRFGKPQTICCWLPNSVFGGSLSQNSVRSTLWWTIKDANGRSLME